MCIAKAGSRPPGGNVGDSRLERCRLRRRSSSAWRAKASLLRLIRMFPELRTESHSGLGDVIGSLIRRGRIKRTAGTVSDDFGSYIWPGKGIKCLRVSLLFGDMTGMQQVGIPHFFRIAQASRWKEEQEQQKAAVHRFILPLLFGNTIGQYLG